MSQRTDLSYRENLMFLQGAYPDWTPDDLGSVLTDCNNDVSLAVTRISSGRAYHWGSVSRKKDKKPTPNSSTKDTASARGESRAGRGGRGGRGGPGRGGAATRGRGGPSRVGHVNGRSHTASPRHASAIDSSASVVVSSAHSESADIPKPAAEANGDQNNATDPWTDHKTAQPEVAITSAPPKSVQYDAPTPAAPLVNLPPSHKQVSKAVKLSWAQIASKQTPKPTPLLPVQSPASAPLEQTSTPAPAPPEESEPVPEPAGWEEPTTVQHPSWESDPSHSSPAVDLPSEESKLEPSAPSLMPEKSQVPSRSPTPAQEPAQEPTPAKVEPLSQPVAPSLPDPPSTSATIIPPSLKSAPRTTVPSSRAGVRNKLIDQPVVMPSSFGSVEKVGMQFGSLSLDGESLFESTSTSTELETPAISATAPEAVAAPTTPGKPQYEASSSTAPPAPPAPPVLAPAASASLGSIPQPQQQVAQMSPVAQHQPHPSAAGAQSNSQQPLPTSVSQPPQSTQTPVRTSAAAASPLQQYTHQPQIQAQQPSLTALQQQPQQPQQNHHQLPQHHNLPQQVQQSHTHHQYSQHFPAQLESQQQHLPSVAQHQQPQNAAAQSNYFRQNDTSNNAPYFHTPTPSTGQAQDYSAFNQLGQQSQHQQASHLGGFGSVDYGYDNQRGFYDSYPQQTGFNNNRGVLSGHDEIKDLPGSQQPPANSLPPSTTRTSQQNANQPQSVGGQGPQQQFPPPPVPYYYPYQNQYYSVPYTTAYNTQPYPVKYPAMFQHGPPGANSVPNSAGKQPGQNVSGVQPQNNPYSASLYQQGYDDYSQPHHLPQNLGLSQSGLGHVNEFGKFYGSGQGFVGLGAQSGGTASGVVTGAGGASGPRNAGSSPETQFKYQKDNGIGVGGGRGAGTGSVQGGTGTGGPGQGGVQPTQGQGQGGAQAGPQGQGYYGSANRFGSGSAGAAAATGGIGATGVGIGGPQQNVQLHHPHHQQGGPQGHHPGYLQNTNDGILWYQGQQSYWR